MNNSFKIIALFVAAAAVMPVCATDYSTVKPGDVIGTIGGETVRVSEGDIIGKIGGPIIKIKDTATMKAIIEYLSSLKEGDMIGTIGGPVARIENIAVIKVLINCLQAQLNLVK